MFISRPKAQPWKNLDSNPMKEGEMGPEPSTEDRTPPRASLAPPSLVAASQAWQCLSLPTFRRPRKTVPLDWGRKSLTVIAITPLVAPTIVMDSINRTLL